MKSKTFYSTHWRQSGPRLACQSATLRMVAREAGVSASTVVADQQ